MLATYWRCRFVYGLSGSETDWSTDLPARPWAYRAPSVGGQRTAASGVPAGYTVRRDHMLVVPLRIYETEWTDLLALIDWANAGAESFTFYPDADVATSFACYLESPAGGDDVAPVRNAEFPQMLELSLTLRKVNGQAWSLEYFPDA